MCGLLAVHGIWLAACGSVQAPDDPDGAAADGPVAPVPDAGGGGDDGPTGPAARCDPSKPFGAPVLVDRLNTSGPDEGAHLTADELTVFLSRYEQDKTNLYMATRPSIEEPFDAPVAITVLNTGKERWPAPSADGLAVYFLRDGVPHVASRHSTAEPFGPASAMSISASTFGYQDLYSTSTGLYLTAVSFQRVDIIRVERLPSGDFGPPDTVEELAGGVAPVLSGDQQLIYWSTTRTDGGSLGGLDVWEAQRAPSGTFANPKNVTVVNSSRADQPTWVSPDGCVLYLQSERSGNADIYAATRPR